MSRPRSRTATASAARKTGTIQVGERVGGSHGPLTAPYRGAQGRITGLPRYKITGSDSKARMVVQTSFLTMSSIVTPSYDPYQLFALADSRFRWEPTSLVALQRHIEQLDTSSDGVGEVTEVSAL
jgi:hypothetical protein